MSVSSDNTETKNLEGLPHCKLGDNGMTYEMCTPYVHIAEKLEGKGHKPGQGCIFE